MYQKLGVMENQKPALPARQACLASVIPAPACRTGRQAGIPFFGSPTVIPAPGN